MDGTELGATVAIAPWPVSGSDDGLVIWVELLLHAMADERTTTKNAGGEEGCAFDPPGRKPCAATSRPERFFMTRVGDLRVPHGQ